MDISALEMSALTKLKRDFLRIVLVGRAYVRARTRNAQHVCAHGFPRASHPHHQIPAMDKAKNISSHS